ncbi:hypothetical protein DFH11DRAFT_1545422 [Phellopilus nigrolimitatus]|nr:hypothetical protein DFH11DRAFT_1545422 [Phellopilus nigrolimitatus]
MSCSGFSNRRANCPRLIFSNNSLRNNVLECDSQALYYRLFTPTNGILKTQRVTQVTRWDARSNREIIIAEWSNDTFKKDQLKMYSEARFRPMRHVLRVPSTYTAYTRQEERTFVANNGKRYTWECGAYSTKLYCEDNNEQKVASFHRRRYVFFPQKAHIKLFHGYEDILDYLVERFCREQSAAAA